METIVKRRGRPPKGAVPTIARKPVKTVVAAPDDPSFEPIEPPPVTSGPDIDYGFHFLENDEDYGDKFRTAMEGVTSARKNQSTGFQKMSDIQEGFAFPLKHFLLQQAVGQYGIPQKKIIDIIGAEGIGKSTLTMQMLGWAMDVGCPALYIECESKLISPARTMRCLHPDFARSYKMLSRLRIESVNSLDHMWQVMKDFVYIARGTRGNKDTPRVPMHVPLVIAVDPWSKLLNPDEACGFYNYGDNLSDANKKKLKDINEGSNLGHAKWAHKWCRLLPAFLKQYNVSLIIVHHQNAKIDMSGGKGAASYMTAEASALYNKTRIGGNAINQNTALTLIISRKGLSKNSAGDTVGNLISARVAKNSIGPDNGKFFYELKTGFFNDTMTSLDPAINFNIGFATMCAEQKWLSTSVKGAKFSSPVLGVNEVSAEEFYTAFELHPDAKINLGRTLGINGYVDVVDNIRGILDKNYHAEYDGSIESDVEHEVLSKEEIEALRQQMEASALLPIEELGITDTDVEHLQSVLSDIDANTNDEVPEDQ